MSESPSGPEGGLSPERRGSWMSPPPMIEHPYNRDHACLGCAYRCACRERELTCEKCGKTFPPRTYNGTDLAFCSAACDPTSAQRWASPFVFDHLYATGCCEVADYLHAQAPQPVNRVEAAALGLGQRGPQNPQTDRPMALSALAPRVITRNLSDGRLHLRVPAGGQLIADERCVSTSVEFERIKRIPESTEADAMCELCWPRGQAPARGVTRHHRCA